MKKEKVFFGGGYSYMENHEILYYSIDCETGMKLYVTTCKKENLKENDSMRMIGKQTNQLASGFWIPVFEER